jgi:hypothetical protein
LILATTYFTSCSGWCFDDILNFCLADTLANI